MSDLISRQQLLSRLNSTGINITLDLPVEEILGENVNLDDFATLMQDAIQAYRKMVIDTIKNMPTESSRDKVTKQLSAVTTGTYADTHSQIPAFNLFNISAVDSKSFVLIASRYLFSNLL